MPRKETPTFRITNWEEYQHYSDRRPPWIKLHNSILDDYSFACLQDDSKLLLILCFLLASKLDNEIPADPQWLQHQLGLGKTPDLQPLFEDGFITWCKQPDSTAQASRYQSACLETETEAEVQRQSTYVGSAPRKTGADPVTPPCPEDLRGLSLYDSLEQYSSDKRRRRGVLKLWTEWAELREHWEAAFPALDVVAEVRAAHAWELSHKSERKVNRIQFLGNWLQRSQSNPRLRASPAPEESSTSREEQLRKEAEAFELRSNREDHREA